MLITNQSTVDYWFGPMHLPAGIGQTLTLDDTTDTSLYLLNDEVADAVNTLYLSGIITVSSANQPFPRPTGVPQVLHGDGSPNGLIYAPQGSMYMRRDNLGAATCLYAKTTGVESNTGWTAISADANAAPTGVIQAYGAALAPTGWLVCDGSAVSRTTYSALYGVIGITYGNGDGSTTFNVPDLRGRLVAGYAASGGHADVSTLGNNDGVAEANRRPKHNHTVTDPGHSHNVNASQNSSGLSQLTYLGDNTLGFSSGTTAATTGVTVGPGGTASIDAPAYLVLNHIIKT